VFTGIAGVSLALSPFVDTVLYCEINGYCQEVLGQLMKNGKIDRAPVHGNIKTLHLDNTEVNMICGGFPCTDISSIGLKRGINSETRSGLFLEMMRLVDENSSINIVFLENVSNIIRCGMKQVVEELQSRGFTFCWKMQSASSMGAPHQRTRWFCLAVRGDGERCLAAANIDFTDSDLSQWDQQPEKRITLRPSVQNDEDFDTAWANRCGTLGNTVVPIVVRKNFVELSRIIANTKSIMDCFNEYASEVSRLKYPFPETGIVIGDQYFPLPQSQSQSKQTNPPSIPIATIDYNGRVFNYNTLPTPRHGITHPSTPSDRSIKDLPTILVYCQETKDYLEKHNIDVSTNDKLHRLVTPNVGFIEWMMGYPKDWTKIEATVCPSPSPSGDKYEDGEEQCLVTNKNETIKKPKYNGMHVFMKEHPGKSIIEVAGLWRSIDAVSKRAYAAKAKTLYV
jgi:DNA (cytosine-5)-methyltransferase 1